MRESDTLPFLVLPLPFRRRRVALRAARPSHPWSYRGRDVVILWSYRGRDVGAQVDPLAPDGISGRGGYTPLMLACAQPQANPRVVELLLQVHCLHLLACSSFLQVLCLQLLPPFTALRQLLSRTASRTASRTSLSRTAVCCAS